MAEKKRITLHPIKEDGHLDLDINLYPKTLIDGIVDLNGEEVEVALKSEIPSDYVTLDTEQTITGRKNFGTENNYEGIVSIYGNFTAMARDGVGANRSVIELVDSSVFIDGDAITIGDGFNTPINLTGDVTISEDLHVGGSFIYEGGNVFSITAGGWSIKNSDGDGIACSDALYLEGYTEVNSSQVVYIYEEDSKGTEFVFKADPVFFNDRSSSGTRYGLTLPETTNWRRSKTIATKEDFLDFYVEYIYDEDNDETHIIFPEGIVPIKYLTGYSGVYNYFQYKDLVVVDENKHIVAQITEDGDDRIEIIISGFCSAENDDVVCPTYILQSDYVDGRTTLGNWYDILNPQPGTKLYKHEITFNGNSTQYTGTIHPAFAIPLYIISTKNTSYTLSDLSGGGGLYVGKNCISIVSDDNGSFTSIYYYGNNDEITLGTGLYENGDEIVVKIRDYISDFADIVTEL